MPDPRRRSRRFFMLTPFRTPSWRTKLLLLLLLFAMAPMLALAIWSFEGLAQSSREGTIDGLQALAQAKAEALDQSTTYRMRDVEQVATLMAPFLTRLASIKEDTKAPEVPPDLPKLEDAEAIGQAPSTEEEDESDVASSSEPPVVTPSPATKETLEDIKRTLKLILWDQQIFEELLVMDSDGKVIASTYSEHEGTSAADLDYFKSGRKVTYVQPVFESPLTKELTMVISTPIRSEIGDQLGVVAARLNLKRFFRLINDTTGLGETGETVVAKKIEDAVVLMAPTRLEGDAKVRHVIDAEGARSRGLREAVRGQRGSGLHLDYRDKQTFAAWRHVPALNWGLLVKIDVSEAMGSVMATRDRTAVLGLLIIVLVVLASVISARALVQPLRELKEATDRISRGDLTVELNIRSNDEIGELADSFERMVAAIKFFREQSQSGDEEEDSERAPESGSGEP